jgi:restriction endonuclease Mrr
VEHIRTTGRAESYADRVLATVDIDVLLRGVEDDGKAIVRAAESDLRARGVNPATATYREYAEALSRVSR